MLRDKVKRVCVAVLLTIGTYGACAAVYATAAHGAEIGKPTVLIKSEGKLVEVIQFQKAGGEETCAKMAGAVKGDNVEAVCTRVAEQGYSNGVTYKNTLLFTTATEGTCKMLAEAVGGYCARISNA